MKHYYNNYMGFNTPKQFGGYDRTPEQQKASDDFLAKFFEEEEKKMQKTVDKQ